MLQRYFCILSLIFSVTACTQKDKGDFIYVEGESFKYKDSSYFPILMNYMLSVHKCDDSLVIGPSVEYDRSPSEYATSSDAIYHRMRLHFRLIRQMGFNSLRLVGLNPLKYQSYEDSTIAQLEYFEKEGRRELFNLDPNQKGLIRSLKKVVEIAREEDLHLMLLLPKPKKNAFENRLRLRFIRNILETFRNDPTVFAYDFFNEPLYFDNSEYQVYKEVNRNKKDARTITKSWKKLMQELAPNQLFTLGLAEPIEVFEWDPNILEVDFLSIHTYHPLRVPNEIYWFSKFTDKAWIITETSLPADNDSISYQEQAVFMKETLQRTLDCGGSGFGWWQFQDVSWGPFEHDYTAIMNRSGYTYIDGDSILGTAKPAAEVLRNFDLKKKGECKCHINYYNMMGYQNFMIEGKLINKDTEEPIEGAVIRGWNQDWSIGLNTFTNGEGVYRIYSNDECVNFEISATGMQTVKFYLNLNYDTIATERPLVLNNQKLEYHSIHYQSFLDSSLIGNTVFDFNKDFFDNYLLKASIHEIELKELER